MQDNHVCYTTELTNDVIGYLTKKEVLKYLKKSKNLYLDVETNTYRIY
nr:MAG TPA: hypothetical protein [Bacteriophage sp.]